MILSGDPSRTDLQWIEDQEIGNTPLGIFNEGRSLDPAEIENVRFIANDNPPTDLLPNPIGLSIVSQRLKAILEKHIGPAELQFLAAPVFSAETGDRVDGYFIANPLRMIAALTPSCAAGNKIVNQLEIDVSKVSDEVHVFRLAERRIFLVVSGEILQTLFGQGLQGLLAIRIRSVEM